MKVTAGKNFKQYRNAVLGLDKKDFRALQSGKVIDITKGQFEDCPDAYIEIKNLKEEVKDGGIHSI